MRKYIMSLLSVLIVLVFNMSTFAIEEMKTKYFGVGATVEEVEQATFVVTTKGQKTGEGFVFTPDEIESGENATFQVSLEGTGTVYMKLVETDASGKFIKKSSSPMILLTSDWKEYTIPIKLHKATKQVDISVITDSTQQTEFKFRDVYIAR